jgi:hypothetical protein
MNIKGRFISLLMGFRSPIARRVTLSIFLAIVFIEIVILVPSYLNRENQLIDDVVELTQQLAGIEFHAEAGSADSLSRQAQIEALSGKAREILHGRYMRGALILEDGKVIASAGDTDLNWRPGNHNENASITGVPIQRLERDRLAIYLSKSAHEITNDVLIIADISHIPVRMSAYVQRIGALVLIISLFVTGRRRCAPPRIWPGSRRKTPARSCAVPSTAQ